MERDAYWARAARRRASRRNVLRSSMAGAAGLAAYTAVGCGDDDDDDEDGTTGPATEAAGRDTSQLPEELRQARYGGTARFAINDPPQTFDFHTQEPPGSHAAAHPAYNGLIYRIEDEPGRFSRLEPELAESWEQVDDTTFLLKIRQGVKYQDVDPLNGRDFTAQDVVYNLERIKGQHPAASQVAGEFRMRDMFEPVESITATDDYTVEIRTAFPFAPLLNYLSFSWVQMIPRELVEATGDRNVLQWAVGTGPFILDGYDTLGDGGTIRYVRNPNYWKPGQPFFDRYELLIMTAPETIQARFLSNEIDTAFAFDAAQTEAIQSSKPDTRLIEVPGFYVFKMYFDMSNQDSPWTRDKRLRQAQYYLLPYQVILQAFGVDCCRSGPVPPNLEQWALSEDELPAAGMSQDEAIQRALQLMEEAGFPRGTEIPLELSVSQFYGGSSLAEAASGIFGSLRGATDGAVNIAVQVNQMELADWIGNVYRGGGRYQATIHADWNYDDPDHSLYSYYHSTAVANNTHTNIPELDDLLERQRRELNEDARIELVKEIQRLLLDEAPTIYIAAPNNFAGAQTYLQNYRPMVLNNVETPRHIDEWWFSEDAPSR